MDKCSLFDALFWAALACAVIGNLLGLWAWRRRLPEQPKWRPLRDQFYLFRPSLYTPGPNPARFWAIAVLGVGIVLVVGILVIVLPAISSGARDFCGSVF